MIFFLMPHKDWQSSSGRVATPGEDGFVHCCNEQQIADVRQRYFSADVDVVALAFDPTKLLVETRYEPGTCGEALRFPHVYGVLQREFVAYVRDV